MLFNSAQFLVFFPIVLAAYFTIAHRFRWMLLLAASCYFYMVLLPKYILILFVLILVDYAAGLAIEMTTGFERRAILALSLAANVGMLAFFKYFNFLSDNLSALMTAAGWHRALPMIKIVLPIGISFHTFQSMSYTLEVYAGRQKAERHLGIYAVYVLFFPQLVAGPIERPGNLLRQFRAEHAVDGVRIADGLRRMAWGLFKKVVVADRLSLLVSRVFGAPRAANGWELALGVYFFTFQIYCDFSGYSDIALGSAQVMGFTLMENFNKPYAARSIADFWKRWHISLSTWFRDYLYIPLGGNRVPEWRRIGNVLIVFLVSGFWHGANWTFVLWGAIHGLYLIASMFTEPARRLLRRRFFGEADSALLKALSIVLTFHLVALAWIPFRAQSVSEAWLILRRIFTPSVWRLPPGAAFPRGELAIAVAAIALLEALQWFQSSEKMNGALMSRPPAVRWLAYGALASIIVMFGQFDSRSFIYFQF
jgi:alginate O-acetyltransferase complex protein AlgI